MALFKRLITPICVLLLASALLAQGANPSVEVILSTDHAQKGDIIYADVVIRNGHSISGADVGIITDDCLRVVERLPGNFLPTTVEEGGFSAFSELTDHSTRLASAITNRARLVSGDGTFYRVKMEVTCDNAAPTVTVTFAQIGDVTGLDTDILELVEHTPELGNLTVVNDTVKVQPGAVVAEPAAVPTLVPLADVTAPSAVPAISQNTILIAALAVIVLCAVGIVALLFLYRRQYRSR